MKNLFGKILVGVAGCAMALSISAFAAEVAITDVTADKTTGNVTVNGTIAGDADSKEATILVVEDGVSIASVADDQIRYIDQETAQDGKFSYTFKLDTGKKYVVWCGGTDITAPVDGIADLTSATSGYKIIGTITVAGKLDDVTATAGETAGTVDTETGAYAIQVADGKYDVVIGKPGYLYKTYADVEVAGADKDLGAIELFAGQLNEDMIVDAEDLAILLKAYKKSEEYKVAIDLNDDNVVDAEDLSILLKGYKKNY